MLSTWREVAGVPCKRAVLMSSIGVERRKSFPFVILNAAGVLDAKVKLCFFFSIATQYTGDLFKVYARIECAYACFV